MKTLQERFEIKFARGKPDECWLWTGATNGVGYGTIAPPGGLGRTARNPCARPLLAHRVSYELYIGPIPAGLTIDHVRSRGCSYRACVNPNHLEAVTCAENVRRAIKGTGKLSPSEIAQLAVRRAAGSLLRELAVDAGLSVSRVHALLREYQEATS